MHFSFTKLEDLNVFRTYLMLALQFDGVGTLLEMSAGV